jgi:hypothetical protein
MRMTIRADWRFIAVCVAIAATYVPDRLAAQAIGVQEYTRVVGGTVAQDVALSPKGGWTYFVGTTTSPDYPVTSNAYDSTCGSDGNCNPFLGRFGPQPLSDIVFTVLDSAGRIQYSTFLGGSGIEDFPRIAVAPNGEVWLSGRTMSSELLTGGCTGAFIARFDFDFHTLRSFQCVPGDPIVDMALDAQGRLWTVAATGQDNLPTRNAYQPRLAGQYDWFVMQIAPGEPLPRIATYIGGTGFELPRALAITPSGSVAIVGSTSSPDFPVVRPLKATVNDGITNGDAVIVVLDSSGRFLQFSTYWGGNRDESAEGVAVDGQGNLYVTGYTRSPNMPVTPGVIDERCGSDGACDGSFDVYISKFSSTGGLLASSVYGGAALDQGRGLIVRNGDLVVVGTTQSPDFPLVATSPLRRWTPSGSFEHTFVAVVDDNLRRVTRSIFVADEQYLPNVAILRASESFAYVAGQVSAVSGMSTGIGTYVRAIRLP